MNTETMLMMAVFCILVIASIRDIIKREVATWMMALAGVISLTGCLTQPLPGSLPQAGLSLLPGMALLGLAALSRERMGYGDGIMAALIGPCFGLQQMVTGLFLAFLLSAVVSVGLIALKKAGRKMTIPFLPFLTAGMGVMQLVSG